MERLRALGVWVVVTLVGVYGVGMAGCSGEVAPPPRASEGDQQTAGSTSVPQQQEMLPAFEKLADEMGSVPVFGLASLPSGMQVSSSWWPVIQQSEAGTSQEPLDNPRVESASEGDPEGELLLKCAEGWLDVLANFRGDLGDVSGERVGQVAGMPAYLYQVSGGWLVQWSYEGRWYGVFGRGVPRDVVTSTALDMRLIKRY